MRTRRFTALLFAVLVISSCIIYPSSAIVTSADYTAEELDSSSYDLRKYTIPYWEGNIVYNEVVFPIRGENNKYELFELMYDISEIISVKNNTLNITYKENIDYRVSDGKLQIIPTGNIRIYNYTDMHPDRIPYGENEGDYYPRRDGGYEYYKGDLFSKGISVTYIHNDTWDYPIPDSVEADLPRTMSKLIHKEPLKIVVAGDSVSTGAQCSSFLGSAPFADAYPEMTFNALKKKFGNENITLVNSAIGGTMSEYTYDKLNQTIISYSPDFVILNFGMNDSSCDRIGIPKEQFAANMAGQIEYIKQCLPNCEILLLSSLYGNPYTFIPERYEEHAGELHILAEKYDGVAVCDPQNIMKGLLNTKDYLCFMNDNIVHPNDYGMRLMAQTILYAMDVSDIPAYRKTLIEDLTAFASPDDHVDDGKRDELISFIEGIERDISTLDDEWDINEIISQAYSEIEFVLGRCAFEDHVFSHKLIKPTCKESGYTHSVCSVCGYEYDHDYINPIGGEHIMDNGRLSTSPTYKSKGVFTYTCAKCGYEENEIVPMLSDPPESDAYGSMLYVEKGYNYMASNVSPYRNGGGTVEVDVCPLNIDADQGVPYVGVWISNYSITACYNFKDQQVALVSTNLPFGGVPKVHAAAPYEWTTDSGENDYNWKKFAVKVTGNTVSIYIDGELILSDTNSRYHATNEVMLIYSIGEYYFDNFAAGDSDYNPFNGSGTVLRSWDLDSQNSINAFRRSWGQKYTPASFKSANAADFSTGNYNHVHVGMYLNTVERSCNLYGYREYQCTICGKLIRSDFKDPIYPEGHTLINRNVKIQPTETTDGLCVYECANCFTTFTEVLPAGSIVTSDPLVGDLNGDNKLDYIDLSFFRRWLVGDRNSIDIELADVNRDGVIGADDIVRLSRIIMSEQE